jgi:outer membrane immunogenic protein
MKKSALAGVLLSGLLGGAAAAAELAVEPRAHPLPPPPPPRVWSWSGFYMGVNGGYSTGADDYTQTTVLAPAPVVTLGSFARNTNNPKGGLFGAQGGFNWQTGPVVWGLEGDLQGASQSATACGHLCFQSIPGAVLGTTVYQKLKWFNTARARVGYANGPTLFYITGGWAWAGLDETDTISAPPPLTQAANFSNRVSGSAVGAGAEVRLWWGWTGKLEYLHLELGGTTNTFALVPPVAAPGSSLTTITGRIRDDIIRVGLNWQFGLMGQTGWSGY